MCRLILQIPVAEGIIGGGEAVDDAHLAACLALRFHFLGGEIVDGAVVFDAVARLVASRKSADQEEQEEE